MKVDLFSGESGGCTLESHHEACSVVVSKEAIISRKNSYLLMKLA